jgi:hypothetical protein
VDLTRTIPHYTCGIAYYHLVVLPSKFVGDLSESTSEPYLTKLLDMNAWKKGWCSHLLEKSGVTVSFAGETVEDGARRASPLGVRVNTTIGRLET